MDKLHEGWVHVNMAKFAITSAHTCSRVCTFVQLRAFLCPDHGSCIGGGLFPLIQRERGGKQVCVEAKNICYGKPHTLYADVKMFGCVSTGNAHFCGKVCDQSETTHEGYSVCDFTGHILSEQVVASKPPLPAGCVFRDTSDYKSEYIRPEPMNVKLQEFHRFVASGLRKMDPTNARERVFDACLVLVAQYLTVRVNVTNGARIRQRDSEVRDALVAYASARRRTSKVNALGLCQIAACLRSNHPLDIVIRMDAGQIRKHASALAVRIVALMGVTRGCVKGGKKFVDTMPLKSFFLIALEMCRQGMVIEHHTLLSSDPILMLIAKGSDDISLFWQEHVDNKRIYKSMAKMPNKLRTLFFRAVTEERVNPEHLRIDEIPSHLHVPTDYFEDYRV